MKRLLSVAVAAGLLLLPVTALAQNESGYAADQTQGQAAVTKSDASAPPPVAQELVREGDFSVMLAAKLKLGEPASEAEAQAMLVEAGIAPKNGWISDYPVTPDIIAELEESIGKAADAGKIAMSNAEATGALYNLTAELGLPVKPAAEGEYVQTGEPTVAEYVEPTVINNYYYEEGPPVITYYEPPLDYFYLYGWVPYPFWWYGFYFPGYYILHDFSVIVHHHHHNRDRHWARDRGTVNEGRDRGTVNEGRDRATVNEGRDRGTVNEGRDVVSNHYRDRDTRRFERIDPVTRHVDADARTARSGEGRADRNAFRSEGSRQGASSIVRRSIERSGGSVAAGSFRSRGGGEAAVAGTRTRSFTPDSGRSADRPAVIRGSGDRGSVGSGRSAGSRGDEARATVRSERSFDRGRGGGFSAPSRSADRSFSAPSRGGGFSAPSRSAERSFSAPSRGGGFSAPSRSADRSFSAPSTGRSGGGGSFSAPSRGGGSIGRGGGGSGRGGGGGSGRGGGGGSGRGGGGCRGRC